MPLINLIQEQRLVAERLEHKARLALFTFVGAATAIAASAAILFVSREGLQAEANRLQDDLKKTSPIVAEIEANDKEQALLTPRLQTLVNAQKTTDRWSKILKHLQTQTPAGTWLTGLHSTGLEADKPVGIILSGTSKDQIPIGEFILRVENEPDLENVALHFTQEKPAVTGKTIDFEVGADIAGTIDKPKVVKQADSKAGEKS